MGAMFIGQQFLQNVLGYSTVEAGARDPARRRSCMVIVAPRSAKLVEASGARLTLLFGYVFVLLGFLTMLLLWKEDISYWKVALGYAFVGIGVGLAGTPASHSLTGSVPVKRVGMASGTADLQRDLGGAIMQSIFGALLTAGYAAAAGAAIAASGKQRQRPGADGADEVVLEAPTTAARYPTSVQDQIVAGREDRRSCRATSGRTSPGSSPSLLGAALVFFKFPKRDDEQRLLAALPRRRTPHEQGVQGQDRARHPRLGAGLGAVSPAGRAGGRARTSSTSCSTTSASRRWSRGAG